MIVSACLAGINCNYKGESVPDERIIRLVKEGKAIPVCPEQLGGLTTPRKGARITSSREEDVLEGTAKVLTDGGTDVTENYVRGAKEVLCIARKLGVACAVLKQGSPSCGSAFTRGGEKVRAKVPGKGVTAALLEKEGLTVLSEENQNFAKSLKFVDELAGLVLSGKKNTTWRLFDDKDLRVDDIISLLHSKTKEEFGKARILSVKETTFRNLTPEDWEGHEKFKDHGEVLKTYAKYYKTEVTNDTVLKIIKFELLKNNKK